MKWCERISRRIFDISLMDIMLLGFLNGNLPARFCSTLHIAIIASILGDRRRDLSRASVEHPRGTAWIGTARLGWSSAAKSSCGQFFLGKRMHLSAVKCLMGTTQLERHQSTRYRYPSYVRGNQSFQCVLARNPYDLVSQIHSPRHGSTTAWFANFLAGDPQRNGKGQVILCLATMTRHAAHLWKHGRLPRSLGPRSCVLTSLRLMPRVMGGWKVWMTLTWLSWWWIRSRRFKDLHATDIKKCKWIELAYISHNTYNIILSYIYTDTVCYRTMYYIHNMMIAMRMTR